MCNYLNILDIKKEDFLMNIMKIIIYVICVICVTYAVFRPLDVLSWWWVKAKAIGLGFYNLIKDWIK